MVGNAAIGGKPTVLYLSMVEKSPSYEGKLAGIRRYCSSRGWEAVPVIREDVSAETLPDILQRHQPVGCVVEGVGRKADLPPRLFRGVPVSYIGYPLGKTGRFPNYHFDADEIAKAAFRELSASMPPCYAAVGTLRPWPWSRRRVRAFRAIVLASGATCHVFPERPSREKETWDAFVERLAPWLAALPEHCAVFVVSDETAVRVVDAARIAMRHIPRSLTLLSVDNFADICENADPPISSIQLDFEREGFLAAKALEEVNARGNLRGIVPSCGKNTARPEVGPYQTSNEQGLCDSPRLCASALKSPTTLGPLITVRRTSTAGHGRHEPHILAAVEMIRREACDGLSAREVAARFPGSRRLFELRFREAMGHSVLDEILHVRLEKAFTLLARTDTAIGAVPALCGFRCDRTLDALFRSRCGMSMSEWRRRNRE